MEVPFAVPGIFKFRSRSKEIQSWAGLKGVFQVTVGKPTAQISAPPSHLRRRPAEPAWSFDHTRLSCFLAISFLQFSFLVAQAGILAICISIDPPSPQDLAPICCLSCDYIGTLKVPDTTHDARPPGPTHSCHHVSRKNRWHIISTTNHDSAT